MGQVRLTGENRVAELEKLVPGDIAILKPGRTRYSAFTQDDGTILDDLMITNAGDSLFLVINAACKDDDIVHMRANLGDGVSLKKLTIARFWRCRARMRPRCWHALRQPLPI